MKRWILGAVALTFPVCLQAVEHADTYQRTFQVGGADRKLIVENINGSVVVTADSGSDIRLTVRERYRADSAADLDQLRKDVKVEMEQTGNTVRVYLDGPFRDRNHNRDRHLRNAHFSHEFEVQVPRDIALDLKSINGGEVRAQGTRGEFHLKNINGKVRLLDATGSGAVETINGGVQVTFMTNPSRACEFKSLNGLVDVAFQPDLSADLRMKSMNGNAYTDFDFTGLPNVISVNRSEKPLRIRTDTNRVVRVGAGGVEHRFETLNGNIKITKYGKSK
jgi:DUF4097 and DUF4098 domain-containing protein YvlB